MSLAFAMRCVLHTSNAGSSGDNAGGRACFAAKPFRSKTHSRITCATVRQNAAKARTSHTLSATASIHWINAKFLFRLLFVKYETNDAGKPTAERICSMSCMQRRKITCPGNKLRISPERNGMCLVSSSRCFTITWLTGLAGCRSTLETLSYRFNVFLPYDRVVLQIADDSVMRFFHDN